ncbi:MAG: DNA polymerase I [bacterium]
MKRKTLLLLDTNALLHRAWHALPPTMTSPDGVVVNAVYGVSSMLMKLLEAQKPDYAAACFDMKGPTFRHKLSDIYKATREKKPDELYAQIPLIKEVLDSFGIPVYEKEGFEADDVLGTISKLAEDKVLTHIVTGDQDSMQLVDDNVHVLYLRTGINDLVEFDPKMVLEKYGFKPTLLIDYKALRGDSSDNIKGVNGIGEKTALALIQNFGTVEEIYDALEHNPKRVTEVAKTRGMTALTGSKQSALDAKVLTTIVRDVPLKWSLSEAEMKPLDYEKIKDIFLRFGFRSLMRRLELAAPKVPTARGQSPAALGTVPVAKTDVLITEAKNLPAWLKKTESLAILVRASDGTLFSTGKVVLLASENEAVSIAESLIPELRDIFGSAKVAKTAYEAKDLMHLLDAHKISFDGLKDDVAIGAYLIEAGTQNYDLDTLARKYLGRALSQGSAAAQDLFVLAKRFREELSAQNGMEKLYEEIELPTVAALFKMERAGIKLNSEYLQSLSKNITKRVEKLEREIIEIAGGEFNVNSPSQLAEVLFDKLNLPSAGLKRTKTGVSTAEPELEKIEGDFPIIAKIFEQRELRKLLSTYIETLPKLVARDGRIHTTYQQTVTSTGRLSSSNPNLQNIPIQTDLGNEIRKAFVAEEGNVLIAADYSQIQLRIAAHLSRDKNMMDAFRSGADIHTSTAAKIFDVPLEKVTSEQRRQAKTINFGILYGMGAQALARGTGMTVGEARQFIAKYFEVHPGIRSYMEEIKLLARTQGYVETPFGRRRYFPDINSGIPQLVASAERMAMNMPIQGMEADIMKLATLKVIDGLGEVSSKARLLLQVHDELVLEAPKSDAEKVAKFLEEVMTEVAKLEVPVKVNVEIGLNWGEMEE